MKTSNMVWTVVVLLIIAGLIWYVMQAPQPNQPPTSGSSATSTQPAGGTGATSSSQGMTGPGPQISSLSPQSGKADSTVTVTGTGFSSGDNLVVFGSPGGTYHRDGLPDNVIAHASSTNGTSITFVVPAGNPGGELCDKSGTHCKNVTATKRQPGSYDVVIVTTSGHSNAMPFTLQ